MLKNSFLTIIFLFFISACSTNITPTVNTQTPEEKLNKIKEKVAVYFKPMKIRNYDWLESYPESGQTFEEYQTSDPTLPTTERNIIYIQPMGEFSEPQKKVLQLTAEYMKAFYNLTVKLNSINSLENIPKEFQRVNFEKHKQIKTEYFLRVLLPKSLPDDAAAYICFTNYDLYPDDSMNFVFGQATLQDRVGVWSLARLGQSEKSPNEFKIFLFRTLKIAMHETGHMFSMRHCTKYECLMSGTNHLGETDRRPLDVCPECMAKIAWAMKYEPAERYRKLSKFWKEQGFDELSKEFDEKFRAVSTE